MSLFSPLLFPPAGWAIIRQSPVETFPFCMIHLSKTQTLNSTFTHFSLIEACRKKPELVAFIEGGAEVIRGLYENITLNASLSYDPDLGTGNNSGMNFTWHFGQLNGNNYPFPFPGLSGITVQYFAEKGFGPVVIFAKKPLLLNQIYIARVVVNKDNRTSSVFQVIRLQNGEPPKVSLRYTFRQSLFFCCARNSSCH